MVTENQTIQEERRIVGIEVSVDENGDEQIAYTLSKAGSPDGERQYADEARDPPPAGGVGGQALTSGILAP